MKITNFCNSFYIITILGGGGGGGEGGMGWGASALLPIASSAIEIASMTNQCKCYRFIKT